MKDKQIHIELTESAKSFIADNGFEPSFGARPLKRYIQKTVENLVAKDIVANKIKEGDTVKVMANAESIYLEPVK